ncbi:thiolase family protein [Glutamicibacter protophormiae]|uniref:thiolase family protein n=1 Tax=Glutamicibacter protophormiae TaxID=37930 RepID=UPI002A7FDC82|nr:thiolase family protein [Glutamicibacter protophormiae]WPR63231.1 thiolase family protein [Glutamicibacter protophormiae]WPR66727.1 thiolase family protein [Glutamicibacter protophormiae]
MNNAYIVGAARTPIVRAGKEFTRITADRLLGSVIDALLQRAGIDPHSVDHVFAGNAAGPGGNIARVAALASELPHTVPATSVDAQCASGLEAIAAAARMIRCGEADLVIAGGVESASTAPWRVEKQTDPMMQPRLYSRARFTPTPDPDPDMGVAAENIAVRYGISRERQDQFALGSHHKALQAKEAGAFDDELVDISTAGGLVAADTCPRPELTPRKLAALKPAFVPGGSVTAGNACPINDGAAAVVLASERMLQRLGPDFALRYLGAASGASDPEILGMAATPAYRNLVRLLGEDPARSEALIEFNEAFAVQALACLDELGIGEHRVNRQGGALALGHPYGASGAVLVTRLFWQTQQARMPGQRAVALMAAAGGTGSAVAFESMPRNQD